MSRAKKTPESRKLIKTRTPGVFKRGGSYVVIVTDHRGRQHKTAAKTYELAKNKKTELDNAKKSGALLANKSRDPFNTYARDWIKSYNGRSNKGIRDETREEYSADLELYAIKYFNTQQIGTITPEQIETFLSWLANDAPPHKNSRRKTPGLAAGSVRNAYAPVRAMFAQAVIRGHITTSPCRDVIVPTPEQSTDVKALTPDEEAMLLGEMSGKWRLLVRFMLSTGLRISEVVALNVNNIDWDEGVVSITKRTRGRRTGKPKSVKGNRDIPLSPALLAELAAMRDDLSMQGDDQPLWQSLRGHRFNQANIYRRVFKPAARRAGVEWAGWHTLRHTAATRWIDAGWDPRIVAKLLGHADAGFTLRIYTHVLPHTMPTGEDLEGGKMGKQAEVIELHPDENAA